MAQTRRRLSVIGASVAVIAAAGIWYASPQVPAVLSDVSLPGPSTLTGPFTATYDFVTPSLGWAVVVDYSALTTRFFIFHTTDGAAHWYKQYVGKAKGDRPYLHFFDAGNGFAYVGFSYRTVDGGAHWQPVRVPGSQPYVSFATPTDGWAQSARAGAQRIYRTADGGVSWKEAGAAPVAPGSVLPVLEPQTSTFNLGCEGWVGASAINSPAIVFATADCGATWQPIALLANDIPGSRYQTAVRLIAGSLVIAFVSDGSGHVLGAFETSGAADSWRGVPLPTALSAPEAVSFADPDHWWILGAGAVYTSENGGVLWTHVTASGLPGGWNFDLGGAVDPYHAWGILTSTARSQVAGLATTSDGGAHWKLVSAPQP
jgi:hypothetical protein